MGWASRVVDWSSRGQARARHAEQRTSRAAECTKAWAACGSSAQLSPGYIERHRLRHFRASQVLEASGTPMRTSADQRECTVGALRAGPLRGCATVRAGALHAHRERSFFYLYTEKATSESQHLRKILTLFKLILLDMAGIRIENGAQKHLKIPPSLRVKGSRK